MGLGSSGGAAASPGQVVLNSLSLVWAHACRVADLGNVSPGSISAWYRPRRSNPVLYSKLRRPFGEILDGCFLPGLCGGREGCGTTPGVVEAGGRSILRAEGGRKQFNEKNAFSNIGRSLLFVSLPFPPQVGMGWAGFAVVCTSQCSNQLGRFWCLRTHFCFVIASCWDIAVELFGGELKAFFVVLLDVFWRWENL